MTNIWSAPPLRDKRGRPRPLCQGPRLWQGGTRGFRILAEKVPLCYNKNLYSQPLNAFLPGLLPQGHDIRKAAKSGPGLLRRPGGTKGERQNPPGNPAFPGYEYRF